MKRIVMDVAGDICRTAFMEDGKLIELLVDDRQNASEVGNIYIGKVVKTLPSQFAFINIGMKKNAFLHMNDPKEQNLLKDLGGGRSKWMLAQGQDIMVQVIKDATGTKGACVTTRISYTGELVVLLPNQPGGERVGISQKIVDEQERNRLKQVIEPVIPPGFGVIIRTQAQNASAEELEEELRRLLERAQAIQEKACYIKGPAVLHRLEDTLYKGLRELVTRETEQIIVNSASALVHIPVALEGKRQNWEIECYGGHEPIFQFYSIEEQIGKALMPRVWLKSGGFIIIEQTEAAVVVDVNTGKYAGKTNHEATVYKTNLEAAVEIAYQLRLRNLSGMIIIDFIDMKQEEDKIGLKEKFTRELQKDRMNVSISGMTQQGLFILTRKKARESLQNILCVPCSHCMGTGKIKK